MMMQLNFIKFSDHQDHYCVQMSFTFYHFYNPTCCIRILTHFRHFLPPPQIYTNEIIILTR